MINGLLSLPWWGCLLVILVFTHITVMSVTLYFHRSQAHRSVDFHPIASHFFRFWIWLTTGMVTKEWVAIHRKHHVHCETPEDPHSPKVRGLKKVLFQGAELYQDASHDKEMIERYGRGTPDDWIEPLYSSKYTRSLGIFIMLLIDLALFGVIGITFWAIQMMWIPFFAAGVVNGVGHFWGYRNFECPDAARNIVPLGIFLCGEELHNNHHSFATSAKLSVKWWEFDIGWFYICVLRLFRLAKVHRSIPKKLHKDPNKFHMDLDTLKALIAHRFYVMEHYARHVVFRVVREEKQSTCREGRRLLRQAQKFLVREDSIINDKQRKKLQNLLQKGGAISVVYELRLQLQSIWQRTIENPSELMEIFCEWCKRAEATGIKALEDFVISLRTYSAKA